MYNLKTTNEVTIDGWLKMLVAFRDAEARNFNYAAGSPTSGDSEEPPKLLERIDKPLLPSAVTKAVNESYVDVFQRS